MNRSTAESLLRLAEEGRKGLRGKNADVVQAQLQGAYLELLSAFEFFVSAGSADEALRLGSALVPFWMATNRIDDGDRWFDRGLGLSGSTPAVRGRALYEHGYLIFWAGQYERSAELSNQAVAVARGANDATVVALALAVLARIALHTDVEEAKRLLREAIAVTDGTDDQEGRSSAMHVLGVAHQMSGEFEDARRVMSERIALGRETGNEYLVAVESSNLSMVERQLGNLDRACILSRESLETFHRLGDELAVAWSANGHAAVMAAMGQFNRAATMLGFAEAGIERAGGEWPPDERQQYDDTLETLRRGMTTDALDRARAAGRALAAFEVVELAMSAVRSTGSGGAGDPGP